MESCCYYPRKMKAELSEFQLPIAREQTIHSSKDLDTGPAVVCLLLVHDESVTPIQYKVSYTLKSTHEALICEEIVVGQC